MPVFAKPPFPHAYYEDFALDQVFEYGAHEMREADMLMTAEAGWLGEMTGGRDLKKELMEAVQEYNATGRDDGPAVRRLYGG